MLNFTWDTSSMKEIEGFLSETSLRWWLNDNEPRGRGCCCIAIRSTSRWDKNEHIFMGKGRLASVAFRRIAIANKWKIPEKKFSRHYLPSSWKPSATFLTIATSKESGTMRDASFFHSSDSGSCLVMNCWYYFKLSMLRCSTIEEH